MPHDKHPCTAVDSGQLVHLTWRRGPDKPHTALCSSISTPIYVRPCAQEYPTCLRCIDIEARFW